jgi:hypothetical protein
MQEDFEELAGSKTEDTSLHHRSEHIAEKAVHVCI